MRWRFASRSVAVPTATLIPSSFVKLDQEQIVLLITMVLLIVFSFTLNETASVRFAFSRAAPGRRVGKRCVAQTRRNVHRRRCTRSVPAGSLGFTGHSGVNKVAFQGRTSPRKKLKLGTYTLTITATNAASEKAKPQALRFKIVKR